MNYRYIGGSPTDLEGGRPIAPGDFTGDIGILPVEDGETPNKNQQLLEEGLLIEAPDVELDENLQQIPSEPVAEPEPGATGEEPVLAGKALEDRAKELDIEGRASMTADQLRAAVVEAEANLEAEAAENNGGESS